MSIRLHIVFSTKHRLSNIDEDWRTRLHAYIGGIIRNLEAVPEAVGGTNDHVHILASLRTKHCPADFVRALKKAATGWVKDEHGLSDFAWQEGYACISVSPQDKPKLVRYIENQMEHHRAISSKDELVEILKEAGIEFDASYLE